jgi:hypothetical protein
MLAVLERTDLLFPLLAVVVQELPLASCKRWSLLIFPQQSVVDSGSECDWMPFWSRYYHWWSIVGREKVKQGSELVGQYVAVAE